jgi:hypothetical protein
VPQYFQRIDNKVKKQLWNAGNRPIVYFLGVKNGKKSDQRQRRNDRGFARLSSASRRLWAANWQLGYTF